MPESTSTSAAARKPLSEVLPPLVLGTATFNNQYNPDAHALPTNAIIHKAIQAGVRAFDTSPYYGPSEVLLGKALQSQTFVPRSEYIIQTKCGRIAAQEFDYSPASIRKSIQRSLQRLRTDYLDVVFCHDVEFVSPEEVLSAVKTLRELRNQGVIRYVGISGYPVHVLATLAQQIKDTSGEPVDIIMSYGHYTLQNTALYSKALHKIVEVGVECILNASPLGMGLLRSQGVPTGSMGDWHPAPDGLRSRCLEASKVVEEYGERKQKLEHLALRFSIEGWMKDGAVAGTKVKPLVVSSDSGASLRAVNVSGPKLGINVAGVSSTHELDELMALWRDIVKAREREFLYQKVIDTFDGEWKDYSWASPGEGFVNRHKPEQSDDALVKSWL